MTTPRSQRPPRSPLSPTVRIALGPAIDGVWRKRRTTAEMWCSELKAKIEERRAETHVETHAAHETHETHEAPEIPEAPESTKVLSIQYALIAIEKATRIASEIRRNLHRGMETPTLREVEIFTPEEMAIEQKWVDSLVAFPESI